MKVNPTVTEIIDRGSSIPTLLALSVLLVVSSLLYLIVGQVELPLSDIPVILFSGDDLRSRSEEIIRESIGEQHGFPVDKGRSELLEEILEYLEKKHGIFVSPLERKALGSREDVISMAGKKLEAHYLMLQNIFWRIRFPRLFLVLVTGASLACAGAVFQGLLRNPLADPYILGVSSGAGLGAALSIMLGLGIIFRPLFSFAGAASTMFLVYFIASEKGRLPSDRLLLSGVIVGAFLGAIIMFIMTLATRELGQIIYILMGNLGYPFTEESWRIFLILSVVIGVFAFFLLFFSSELDALSLGEEPAEYLGINVERTKKTLFIVTSLMVGVVVSFSGLIGFVGLIVPHMIRMIFGPPHRRVIPFSLLGGALFLVLADLVARTAGPVELPVGVITAMAGAPFFIYLLLTRKRHIY